MSTSKWYNFIKDVGDIFGGILLGASIESGNNAMLGVGLVITAASLYLEHFKKYETKKS